MSERVKAEREIHVFTKNAVMVARVICDVRVAFDIKTCLHAQLCLSN